MDGFSRKILEVIEKFSYDFFIVQQDFDVKCVCINYDTKQADPGCKKCLGTGYKIKIKKIHGAQLETQGTISMKPTYEFITARNYYISSKYPVFKDNIIVDKGQVYFIYEERNVTWFKGEEIYQKCLSLMKKQDTKVFLQNFKEIVKE